MFDPKSRYAKLTPLVLTDARGRSVEVTPPATAPQQVFRGVHVRRDGERTDHLAALYLADPAAFWRLAEFNDAMRAEVLTELREVQIPQQGKT
ncbi:hypothetical protein SAMN02745857_00774 [Andreprevotia lacus DSM 23236]|jgi:hypothetical protein|uniref:Uncharacterized protein n=1 Tax=Andreprevotia lacus DSM 23236 TaxID=1121001 RepID=A0A1W1X700_9NEIS|nr:hypothetical protein [Andreprevotia lacus]SMC19722.1 hypothetical protein SAMN02745857_00774 [Andreprevotia lacus DSM 23236]